MRRVAELTAFFGVSAALHVGAVAGLGDALGGPQGQGAEGNSRATLQAAPDSLTALADRWTTAPSPQAGVDPPAPPPASAAPDMPGMPDAPRDVEPPRPERPPSPIPDAAPMPDRAAPRAAWSAPDLADNAPMRPQAPASPAPSDPVQPDGPAPRRAASPALPPPTQAPSPPRVDPAAPAPPDGTARATDRSPRPALRPDRSAPASAPSAPQPARLAGGDGGGATQGTAEAPAPATPALSAAERQSLMSRWGGRIMARIERARPRVSGSGQVVLALRIARDGRLAGLSVARSSGDPRVDDAALSAVRRAGRFPAAPDGLTEASYGFSLPVRFR